MAIGFFTAVVTSSCDIVSYSWDFDDGSSSTSPNPVHTFPSLSTYSVCLRVSIQDNQGNLETLEYCNDVTLSQPVCTLTPNMNVPVNAGLLEASNLSVLGIGTNLDSTRWEFGDGSFAIANNPQHQYHWSGIYEVCMTSYASNMNQQCQVSVCKPVDVRFSIPEFSLAIAHESEEGCNSTFKASRTLPSEVELIDRVWAVNGVEYLEDELEFVLDEAMEIELIETYTYRGQIFERVANKFVLPCEEFTTGVETFAEINPIQILSNPKGVALRSEKDWDSVLVFDLQGSIIDRSSQGNTYVFNIDYSGMVVVQVYFGSSQLQTKKIYLN